MQTYDDEQTYLLRYEPSLKIELYVKQTPHITKQRTRTSRLTPHASRLTTIHRLKPEKQKKIKSKNKKKTKTKNTQQKQTTIQRWVKPNREITFAGLQYSLNPKSSIRKFKIIMLPLIINQMYVYSKSPTKSSCPAYLLRYEHLTWNLNCISNKLHTIQNKERAAHDTQ